MSVASVIPIVEGDVDDAELLERFSRTRDEAAFAELVRRYGPLVWGVCRRRLVRREDAEDAFQAAFLLLAAKADTIRNPQWLAAWLHRTACRAAMRVATHSPVEVPDDQEANGLDAFAEVARREATAAIDEELVRLPSRYRNPIVLFHMEGMDRRAVAERLGVSEQSVKALLTRGRSMLRSRLARRGVALPLLLPLAVDPVPAQAAEGATRLAVTFGRAGLSSIDLLRLPLKGIQPMTTWFGGKSIAAVAAAAVCLAIVLTVGDPAGADAIGGKRGDAGESIDTALELPVAGESLPLELAQVEPLDSQEGAERSGERFSNVVNVTTDPLPSEGAKESDAAIRGDVGQLFTNPQEQRFYAALAEKTELEFLNTPLSDVLSFLSDRHQINIIPDRKALTDDRISIEEITVDQVLKGIKLQSGLNILLEEHDLAYVIEDEVMKITSHTVAEQKQELKAYEVNALGVDAESVVDSLPELLAAANPDGDPPTIKQVGDRLLIGASLADHMRIMEIMRLMEGGSGEE